MKKKWWRFSKKVVVWLYRFLEAFVAFFFVVVGLAFVKLYNDPMDASFLLPTLSNALLPAESHYKLQVDKAILSAGFENGGLFHLNMQNLQLVRPDDSLAINLPTVHLSYGFWHILTLDYTPSKLTINHPDVQLVIDEQGQWLLMPGQEQQVSEKSKPLQLPDAEKILKNALSFDNIQILDGVLMVEDRALNENISVPQFELKLSRRYGFRQVANFNAVAQISDHLTDIKAQATYSRLSDHLSVEMGITPIYLPRFGRFWDLLKGIDLAVSVSVAADFNVRQKCKIFGECLDKLKFQIKTLSAGTLSLPHPIAADYKVSGAEINGAASAGLKTVKIAKSPIALQSGATIDLETTLKGLDKFLSSRNVADLETVLDAKVFNVKMADVPKVWPAEQGPDAHAWVVEHLSQGSVTQADFKLTFKGDEMADVFGDVAVKGAKVDYLPDMPAITDMAAHVYLYPDKVVISVSDGHAGNVHVLNGDLLFSPLDGDKDTWLNIVLDLSGPIREMLVAINQKPLELLEDVDLDLKTLKGNAETRVQLDFPLNEDKIEDEIKVDVLAVGSEVGLPVPTTPFMLSDGNVNLHVTNEFLDLNGTVNFEDSPMTFRWQEDFTPQKNTSAFYSVQGKVQTAALKKWIPSLEEYVKGTVEMEAELKRLAPDRLWQGFVGLDTEFAEMTWYPLAVKKAKKEYGALGLTFKEVAPDFSTGKVRFDFMGDAQKERLSVLGDVAWGKEWRVAIESVVATQNSFKGKCEKTKDKFVLQLEGDSWNLSELSEMPLLNGTGTPDNQKQTIWPENIEMSVALKQLILNPKKKIDDVQIRGQRVKNLWRDLYAHAVAKDPFVVFFEPTTQSFKGSFGDLGALMSHLNISDDFLGGEVLLTAKQDKQGVISGKIFVDKAELNETGFLLQAASILGIVDGFRGKNIVFDETHAPFELTPEGVLTISDGYAASSNLGVTFRGTVNLDAIELSGAVIPAYAVNSLPGKIPLIGALFREGEGGGLIGAKYSVKGTPANPKVEFHPLSSIAPGALGYIF